MNPEKVLFVDDEIAILEGMTRQLRKTFRVETASSGAEGLSMLKERGPYAVVVSDFRMPEMDGISFLSTVKRSYPDTVRIMLSGHADLEAAIDAVNNGQIFRFLTKPCSNNALATTLTLAIRHYQLVVGERELLNKTLKGSISMLSELLSLTNSRAFSRGYRIKKVVSDIAQGLNLRPLWQYEVAALVCQVGCIAVPTDILKKVFLNEELTPNEQRLFDDHPRVGAHLIGKIPRLENVAEMVENQLLRFDEFVESSKQKDVDRTAIGAQILKAALDYDLQLIKGTTHAEAVRNLYNAEGLYNPKILEGLETLQDHQDIDREVMDVYFDDLVPGMIAADNIVASNGTLVIEKGQEITWPALQGLQNFISHIGIREPIRVWH